MNNEKINLLLGIIDNIEETQEALDSFDTTNGKAYSWTVAASSKLEDSIYHINESISELELEAEDDD